MTSLMTPFQWFCVAMLLLNGLSTWYGARLDKAAGMELEPCVNRRPSTGLCAWTFFVTALSLIFIGGPLSLQQGPYPL